jgi:RimJ/RimL family protein N-acetyltransferase
MNPNDLAKCGVLLHSERAVLEPTVPGHAREMFEVLSDPRLYAFVEGGPPKSVDELERRYTRAASRRSPDGSEGWFEWAVRSTQGEKRMLGYVQATVYVEDDETALAYMFGSRFWGQGYALEACRTLLEHLRRTLGAQRFVIDTDTRNLPSQRLAERLGFRRAETRLGVNHIGDTMGDDFHYVLE